MTIRKTLLDIVQGILSRIDGDEVNSIADTVESLKVANLVKDVYYELISYLKPAGTNKLTQLLATSSATPTVMIIPDNVTNVIWIKYNIAEDIAEPLEYREMLYRDPFYFTQTQQMLDEDQSNVIRYTDPTGALVPVLCTNDEDPSSYTIINNKHVIFNSFNSLTDGFLQQQKTMVFAKVMPDWSMTDGFIPEIEEQYRALFYEECVSQASWDEFKEVNQKAEQKARRQLNLIQNNRFKVETQNRDRYSGYGRRSLK